MPKEAFVNFYGVTKKGWNCQFTLHDDDEFALLERFGKFVAKLEDAGVTPKPVGSQPARAPEPPANGGAPLPPEPPDLPLAGAPAPAPVAAAPAHATTANSDDTFPCRDLTATMRGGKAYWEIASMKAYPKFPTRVWDEVLKAAGFASDQLDPTVVYDLSGYTAHFERNASGNPSKVIKLTKGG